MDESEVESTVGVSDTEPATTASEREEEQAATGKRKRTRANKAVEDHVDSAIKETKNASRTRATKKVADDKPTEAEEGRTTRTRAAAKRAEAEKEKEKEKEVTDVTETKKTKKTAAGGKKKKEVAPPTPTHDYSTPATTIDLTEEGVVIVQQVESVVEEVEVVEKVDTEVVMECTRSHEQRFSTSTSSSSTTATEVAIESLLEYEVLDSEPLSTLLPAKKAAEYPSLSTIIPPSVPSTPLSPPPVPSPTSSASLLSQSEDRPSEPMRSAGLVSWLKAPFSLLGIGGGSAMKKETLPLASVTPGAMLAPALKSSPSTTPATSPVPSPVSSPAASPASSPVLRSIGASPDALSPPTISTAVLPPPLPTFAPLTSVESASAANSKSRKDELKAKLEASKQQMKDKIEEARALVSGGSTQSGGSANTTPTSTPTSSSTAVSSVSLGAERKDSVEPAINRQTAEHIQVIDIVDHTDEHVKVSTAADHQSQRVDGSHFIVAPAAAAISTTSAMDITLLSSVADVTMIEPEESVSDDVADVTMADDGEAKRDDRAEAATKAKSNKADTLKKKDMKERQLEAARKREEVERRRRHLEEAERKKQEEKEEERRKKDEQLRKAKQQATDKKKAATLKPATATTTAASSKGGAAATTKKNKEEKKEIARTLPLPGGWTTAAGGVGGGTNATRSATLPEPLTIVELGSSVSYSTGKEEKEGKEAAMDDEDDMKYPDEEEKESVVLSTYAPIQSQPTQHITNQPALVDMNPPPLPPLPITAIKTMPPPPPLPMKPMAHHTTNPSPNPPFIPLVKFHLPTAGNTQQTTADAHVISGPAKPFQVTISAQQAVVHDSGMSPPPARLPHNKTPPHTQNGTSGMLPPPIPVLHTPEHGKLLPPPTTTTLHPPTATSSSTPHQPKPKTSPQSYIFSPPPKPLLSPDSNNYPMSDHDASDDSDDDSSAAKKRDARVPSWAKEPNLSTALRAQQMAAVDPDSIFPPIDPFSMSLHEIFKGYKRKRGFRERTSSGNWQMDQLSVREEMQYKRDMGYVKVGESTSVTVANVGSPMAATVAS